MRGDVRSHPVRQLHRPANIPPKRHPEQNPCRTRVTGTHRMHSILHTDRLAHVKRSISRQHDRALRSPRNHDGLHREARKEPFHPPAYSLERNIVRAG